MLAGLNVVMMLLSANPTTTLLNYPMLTCHRLDSPQQNHIRSLLMKTDSCRHPCLQEYARTWEEPNVSWSFTSQSCLHKHRAILSISKHSQVCTKSQNDIDNMTCLQSELSILSTLQEISRSSCCGPFYHPGKEPASNRVDVIEAKAKVTLHSICHSHYITMMVNHM